MGFLNFFEKDPVKEYNKLLEEAKRRPGNQLELYDKAIKLIPTKVEARILKGETIFNIVINEMRDFNGFGFRPSMLYANGSWHEQYCGEAKITRSKGKIYMTHKHLGPDPIYNGRWTGSMKASQSIFEEVLDIDPNNKKAMESLLDIYHEIDLDDDSSLKDKKYYSADLRKRLDTMR
jgi:hypothetical protein